MALRDLQEGELISGEFIVKEKSLQEFRNKSGRYMSLVLADDTAQIEARIWDNAESLASQFQPGDVVFIQGRTEKYRDRLQVIVAKLEPRPQAAAEQFVPALPAERINEYSEKFKAHIASVKDRHLRVLLEKIFSDKDTWQHFTTSTAAASLHSAYLGGLLEHTVNVAHLCDDVCRLFPVINRDLLIAAALLHDIGKLDTFSQRGAIFEYSDPGNLLGEPVLGEKRIAAAIRELPDFPPQYHLHLSHLLLSHHGQQDFGAPIVPKTLEAVVLHHVDNLEAKTNGVIGIMKKEGGADKVWSEWSRAYERRIYLPRLECEEGPEETD